MSLSGCTVLAERVDDEACHCIKMASMKDREVEKSSSFVQISAHSTVWYIKIWQRRNDP